MDNLLTPSTFTFQNEWRPHAKQEKALVRTEFETLYGGARGGGKTDAGIVWMMYDLMHPEFRGLVIRKNADDLSDWVDRARKFYTPLGANFAYRPTEIKFPWGAIIKTGHLKDENAYTKYQGHEYCRMLIEELTQIPDEKRYLQLIASCRSTISDLPARVFATTNPGGHGHLWVKRRFIDPSPWGQPFKVNDGRSRIFISATIEDNPTLMTKDPDYVKFLDGLEFTDKELWKAWRKGDWNTFAGQYFGEFSYHNHVIRATKPNKELIKIGGIDWGYDPRPFVFLPSAVIPEQAPNGVKFNRIITYAEITGTKRTPEAWARDIDKTFNLDEFSYIRADPSMFHKTSDGSLALTDQMKPFLRANAHKLLPANNDRIAGWALLHKWMSLAPDGLPYWLVTENCLNLISHLPTLIHDSHKIGDLDTEGLDDEADALRYSLMHFKFIDAKLGAVDKHSPQVIKSQMPIDNEGNYIGINLKAFEDDS